MVIATTQYMSSASFVLSCVQQVYPKSTFLHTEADYINQMVIVTSVSESVCLPFGSGRPSTTPLWSIHVSTKSILVQIKPLKPLGILRQTRSIRFTSTCITVLIWGFIYSSERNCFWTMENILERLSTQNWAPQTEPSVISFGFSAGPCRYSKEGKRSARIGTFTFWLLSLIPHGWT